MKLDIEYKKLGKQVTSQAGEQLNNWDLWKLGTIRKSQTWLETWSSA